MRGGWGRRAGRVPGKVVRVQKGFGGGGAGLPDEVQGKVRAYCVRQLEALFGGGPPWTPPPSTPLDPPKTSCWTFLNLATVQPSPRFPLCLTLWWEVKRALCATCVVNKGPGLELRVGEVSICLLCRWSRPELY